jgi:hypothetical protein
MDQCKPHMLGNNTHGVYRAVEMINGAGTRLLARLVGAEVRCKTCADEARAADRGVKQRGVGAGWQARLGRRIPARNLRLEHDGPLCRRP